MVLSDVAVVIVMASNTPNTYSSVALLVLGMAIFLSMFNAMLVYYDIIIIGDIESLIRNWQADSQFAEWYSLVLWPCVFAISFFLCIVLFRFFPTRHSLLRAYCGVVALAGVLTIAYFFIRWDMYNPALIISIIGFLYAYYLQQRTL